MGRMSLEEALKYMNEPTGFFMLQEDGDTADVKILADSLTNIEFFSIHMMRYNGKWIKVPCFKKPYGDEETFCPLCACNKEKERIAYKKFYIPLYNITDNIFQYWERGVSFKRTLTTLCEKYYPLRDEIFQIERIGAKGDPNTTYELLNVTEDYVNDGLMEEIQEKSEGEEIVDVFSEEAGLVVIKSKEEIEYYLKYGKFEDDTFEYPDENSRFNRRGNDRNSYGRDRDNRRSDRGYSSRTNRYNNEDEEENSGYQRRSARRREF